MSYSLLSRLVGGAFLVVFQASLISEMLLSSAIGTGSVSERLVNLSRNLARLRASNLISLLCCLGIAMQQALLYHIFNERNKVLALAALVCGIAAVITLAMSKIGTYALTPLSSEFIEAGSPDSSSYQTIAGVLYSGLDRQGFTIHNLFYAVAAILWYSLMTRSRMIPLWLSIWGLVAVSLLLIYVLLKLYDMEFDHPFVTPITGLPYLPFEPVLGLWLLIVGASG